MKTLQALAQLCAIVAGVLLTLITLMTCVSVIGRNTIGLTIVGDFELTASVAGAAIALFLPWCQLKRGNIGVDFFTAKAGPAMRTVLDRLGTALLASMMALMTWRTSVGAVKAWQAQSGSMMLGFPEWIVYAFIVPGLALTMAVALGQLFTRSTVADANAAAGAH